MNPLAMKFHELNLSDKSRVPMGLSSKTTTDTLVGSHKRKIACETVRDQGQCRPPTTTCCSEFTLSPNAHKPPSQQPAPLIGCLTSSGNNFRSSKNAEPNSSAIASNDLSGVVGCTTTSAAVSRLASGRLGPNRRLSSGIDRAGRDSSTRPLSSFVTHSIELVNVTRSSDWCRIRLLVGLCLLAVHAHYSMSSVAFGLPAAKSFSTGIQRTDLPYLDEHCNQLKPSRASSSEAGQMLLVLKCDIKPLFELFKRAHGQAAVSSIGKSNHVDVGQELAHMSASIESFVDVALEIISINFCNLEMVNKLHKLKALAKESKLLRDVFNVIAIDNHRSCLERIIPTLPAVPMLIRGVVQSYIDGADQPQSPVEAKGYFVGYQDREFDVDAAIKRSGSLSTVVSLTLAIGATMKLEDFVDSCKTLVQQIDMSWTVLSVMEKLLDDEDNSILRLNNAVLRSLPTTRFADICSQLSARA